MLVYGLILIGVGTGVLIYLRGGLGVQPLRYLVTLGAKAPSGWLVLMRAARRLPARTHRAGRAVARVGGLREQPARAVGRAVGRAAVPAEPAPWPPESPPPESRPTEPPPVARVTGRARPPTGAVLPDARRPPSADHDT